MPDLQSTRRNLKIAVAAMVVADVIAVGVLFSPLVGSAESRQTQLNQMFAEYRKKTRDVEPLRGMPQKIVLAKNQIGDFYKDRFAAKDSELTTKLGKLAAENGIHILSAVRTVPRPPPLEPPFLARLSAIFRARMITS